LVLVVTCSCGGENVGVHSGYSFGGAVMLVRNLRGE